MSDQTRTMIAKIVGDSTSFKKAITDVQEQNKKAEASFKSLTAGVAAGNAVYSGLKSALQSGVSFMQSSVKAADEQELATARLAAGIMNVKSATDKHIGALLDQATALQKTTRFSDEQVVSAQGILATFQLNQQAIAALTPRLADMSEGLAQVTGEMPSLEDNAKLVAKAIGGEDTAGLAGSLRRAGVIMTEEQKNILQYGNMQQRLSIITQVLDDNFKGLAVAAGNTAAGGMAKLHNQVNEVQENIGALYRSITSSIVPALISMVGGNTQAVSSFVIAAVAVTGFTVAVLAAAAAISYFGMAGIMAAVFNPWMLALVAVGALLGSVVFKGMQHLQDKMKAAQADSKQLGGTLGDAIPAGAGQASKALADMQEKLAKLDDEINKSNRDFREQMAEMVKGHQDKVRTLGDQIKQEGADFADANKSRDKSFKDSQIAQAKEHQKKVDSIQQQINKQLSLGRSADAQELADLRAQLDQENQDYAAAAADKQAIYDEDTAKAKAAHDKKTSDLQLQLDQEKQLLDRHAADVAGIRQSDFVDEIDKLKRSHDEQLKSFEQQRKDIIKNSQDTAAGVASSWSGLSSTLAGNADSLTLTGDALGKAMASGFKDAMRQGLLDVGKDIVGWATSLQKAMPKDVGGKPIGDTSWLDLLKQPFKFRAAGGPVTAGDPFVVGEEGPEMFVPNRAGTIVPTDKTAAMLQGSSSTPQAPQIHTTNTFSIAVQPGIYAGMPAELRELSGQIWKEIALIAKSQGVILPQIGITVQS